MITGELGATVPIRRRRFRVGQIVLLVLLGALSALAAEPTTEPLLRLETGMHTAIINRVATDAQGRWAVTASDDKTARVWELASGRQLLVLRPPQDTGNEGKLYAVAMSPDGTIVALGGWTRFPWEEGTFHLPFRPCDRSFDAADQWPSECDSFTSPSRPMASILTASLGRTGNGIRLFDAASAGRSDGM